MLIPMSTGLVQGVAGDPVELASRYDREGADELVFYDITASSDGRAIVMDLVRQVSEQVFIPLTVGGGIRTFEDVRTILKSGADKVSINSAHVHTPEIINQSAESFGSQCIVGAIDALRRPEVEKPVRHHHHDSQMLHLGVKLQKAKALGAQPVFEAWLGMHLHLD